MRVKRVVAGILACVLAGAAMVSVPAVPLYTAAEEETGDVLTYKDFTYEITGSGIVRITGWTGDGGEMVIPSSINGIPVRSIVSFAFDGKNFTSAVVPEGVEKIGMGAFQNNTALTSVQLPDSVDVIPNWAFYGCTSLSEIGLPAVMEDVHSYAFYKTPWLDAQKTQNDPVILGDVLVDGTACKGAVTIPEGVRKIVKGAFDMGTRQVEHNGYTTWENIDCEVTSLSIPSTLKIAEGLNNCNLLEKVTVSAANPWYKVVDNMVLTQDGTEIVFFPAKAGGAVTVPDGVQRIPVGIFSSNENITSVYLPDSVTELEFYKNGENDYTGCFYGCTALASVRLPEGLQKLPAGTFSGCESLASITIPDSVKEVGEDAFSGTAIIDQQKGAAKYAGNWLVDYDYSQEELVVRDGTRGIAKPERWYNSDEELQDLKRLVIPDSVEYIGVLSDRMTENLTEVEMPEHLYRGCLYRFYGSPWAESQKTILDNGMVVMGDVLVDASMMEGDVTVPDGIRAVAGEAFNLWGPSFEEPTHSITRVTLPDSVVRLEDGAFFGCTTLEEVNLPSRLEYLGDIFARENWGNFTPYDVHVTGALPDTLKEISKFALSSQNVETLRYPSHMQRLPEGYASGGGWSASLADSAKEVILPEGLKEISDLSFIGADFTDITIPASVTSIGSGAFADCQNLTDVYYEGTREEWKNVHVDYSGYWYIHNSHLWDADIHFLGDANELGDVNADGIVSVSDVVMLQKWLLQTGKLIKPENADVCADGVTNVLDLCALKRRVLGK